MKSLHPFAPLAAAGAFAALVLVGGGPGLFAQPKPVDGIVELPKVVVTDSRELPPPESWHYAAIPGFEILTNASDRETQKLLRDFQLFRVAIDVVWKGLQEKRGEPISLIICGKGGKFDAFVPAGANPEDTARASLFLKDREQTAIVIDFESKTIILASGAADRADANAAAAIAATTDEEPTTTANTGEFEVNHYRQLYREYVRYLTSSIQPRLPAWLEEGLAQLFMGMSFDLRMITFARLEDPNTTSVTGGTEDRDFNRALQQRALIPLQDFFSVERESETANNPLGSTWAKQAQAFVHLCLYGEGQRYQKGFVNFVLRLQKEPVSEALFKECFGMTYRKMLDVLGGYRDFAAYKSYEYRLPKGQSLPEPAPLALREATQAEIGRIKGDALRLAGHPAAAHTALVAPYIRGESDPRLLASLGLEELGAGHEDRATKLLEAATAAKVERPRAYLELARLRANVPPAAPEGRLSAAQTRAILEPLLAGRSLPPPSPESYELMADTLVRAADTPARDTLNILFEGVNLFPRRLRIAYQTAVLCIRAGEIKGASGLIDHGLRLAPDAKSKALFSELAATLPARPATAPAAAKP